MNNEHPLNLQSVVVQSPHVFAQEIDNDIVMLNTNKREYFGSEIVGQHIWRFMEAPISVAEICDKIMDVFEGVERATCETDTLEFIEELRQVELIEVVNA